MTQRPATSFPPAHLLTQDVELDRLMCPHRFYRHPADVLADTRLTMAEQRAILSSWASQTCASEVLPVRNASTAPSTRLAACFEEIVDALRQLDRGALPPCASRPRTTLN